MPKIIKPILSIGIDISKAVLDVAFKLPDIFQSFQIDNNEVEINKLIKRINKTDFKGKIIIESTAHYHYLAVTLLAQAGFDVRLINPLLTKQYSKSKIRKVKTDKRTVNYWPILLF